VQKFDNQGSRVSIVGQKNTFAVV